MSMPLNFLYMHMKVCIALTYEFQSLLVPSHGKTHLRHHTYLIGKAFVLLAQVVMVKQTEKMDPFL